MADEQPRAYRIGPFRVDLMRHCITDAAHAVLPVSSRAYDALLYLVEHRERVVGKDELMKAVWPKAVVEENNLNQAISSLRRAFGDSRESPRYLATIPGRGYRFIGDVQRELAEPADTTLVPPATPAAIQVPEPGAALPTGQPTTPERDSRAVFDAQGPASTPSIEPSPISRRSLLAVGLVGAAAAGGVLWNMRRSDPSGLPRSIAVHAVQHQAVQVDVEVGRGSETLDQRDGAALTLVGAQAGIGQQMVRDPALHHLQHRRDRLRRCSA